MNTAKLPYIVICHASGVKDQVVSRHRTLDAAERECATLQRKVSSKWPPSMERQLADYTLTQSELYFQTKKGAESLRELVSNSKSWI
jgi:hypothetical protein